jgi:hypothetical protein
MMIADRVPTSDRCRKNLSGQIDDRSSVRRRTSSAADCLDSGDCRQPRVSNSLRLSLSESFGHIGQPLVRDHRQVCVAVAVDLLEGRA